MKRDDIRCSGFSFWASHADKTIKWNLESEQFNCSMNSNRLEVKIQKHCLIGPHIPYQAKMRKRIGVVPIINRPSSLDDDSTISLWFYNDEKLEHEVCYKQRFTHLRIRGQIQESIFFASILTHLLLLLFINSLSSDCFYFC